MRRFKMCLCAVVLLLGFDPLLLRGQDLSGDPRVTPSGAILEPPIDDALAPLLLTQAQQQPLDTPNLSPPRSFNAPPNALLNRFWLRSEYLAWWMKGSSAPPLATTGPSDVLPTLDRPGTVVLFGNSLPGQLHSGGRFSGGFALPSWDLDDDPSPWGVEGTYFFLAQRGNNFAASSPGIPILARPFFDLSSGTPVPVVEGVANPALSIPALSGAITISNPTRMYGFEANLIRNWRADPERRRYVDFLLGFRYVALDEDLNIAEDLLAQDGTGERNQVQDIFSTRNRFYGGQFGVRGQTTFGNLFLRGTGKLALGDMHSEVTINGSTINTLPPFAPVAASGGLLAQATNIGRHDADFFCVVPEVEIDVGLELFSWLRAYVGYNFLYLSRVARPANQIDLGVNTNVVPAFAAGAPLAPLPGGPARPAFQLTRTDFWAQGISVGFEIAW